MCLAQGHNAVTPVRLEPAALRSRVKHSTTEPLRSHSHIEMSNRKSAHYLYVITMRQCQKSILMPQYQFLASSCDCANMDSVKWEILPSANGNLTMLILEGM